MANAERKAIKFWVLALTLISFSSIKCFANDSGKHVTYPKALHGYWEIGHEKCIAPGNPDNDGRIEITETKRHGYEDASKPLRVIQISRTPQAWKIKSELDIYGDKSNQYEIFALSDKNTLTVIGPGTTHVFTRCP